MPSLLEACSLCFYFLAPATLTSAPGLCQINPPANLGPGTGAFWPTVRGSDWCGKFSATDPNIYSNQISWGYGSAGLPAASNIGNWFIQTAPAGGTVIMSTTVLSGTVPAWQTVAKFVEAT